MARLRSNNSSGLKGVTWDNSAKKWKAQIGVMGKNVYLGLSTSLREAGLAYDAAVKIARGLRFSNLNFPAKESNHIILSDKVLRRIRT